jgi:hypothetical protein
MKTADIIAQQDERKAARGNEEKLPADTQPVTQRRRRGDRSYTARIAPWKWKPGQSGNPTGKGRHDLAAEIARAFFEQNAEALYRAFCKTPMKGNAYAFKELADRAYGRMKETIAHERSPLSDVSTPDLEAQIRELEAKLIASLVERGYITNLPQLLQAPVDDSKIQ